MKTRWKTIDRKRRRQADAVSVFCSDMEWRYCRSVLDILDAGNVKAEMTSHATVTRVESLNTHITRVSLDSGEKMDLPTRLLTFGIDDQVQLSVSENSQKSKSDIRMNGDLYQCVDGFSYISCGGLLCMIKATLPPHTIAVCVSISKSRRRNRSREWCWQQVSAQNDR